MFQSGNSQVVFLKLVELTKIKSAPVGLECYIEELRRILKTWSTSPVIVNSDSRVVENINVYSALRALRVRYVPVAESRSELGEVVKLDLLDVYHNVIPRSETRVYDSVVELLEKDLPTPLVKLRFLGGGNLRIWAKLEWYHPFSLSIKDRIAHGMVKEAVERGLLASKRVVYEATSTNTGLALAGLANFYGFKLRVYLPSTAQRCVDYLFKALGAEAVREDAPITTALLQKVLEEAVRDGALVLNQFSNDVNFTTHLSTTAKELDYQLGSVGVRPRAIICGLGTSGHASAISFYFKNKYGDVKVYGVQPSRGSVIPGLRRVETGMKWIGHAELDGVVDVSLEEAFSAVLEVARSDGTIFGLSGGAVLHVAKKLVEEGAVDGDIVVVIPDHGVKYVELLEYLVEKCVETPWGEAK